MIWYAHDEVKPDSSATTTATESGQNGQNASQKSIPTFDLQEAMEQNWMLTRIMT